MDTIDSTTSRPFRRVPAGHALDWWRDGWRSFKAAPLPWIGLALGLVVVLFIVRHLPLGHLLYELVLAPLLAFGTLYAARLAARPAVPPGVDAAAGALGQTAHAWGASFGRLLGASLLVVLLSGAAVFACLLLAGLFGLGMLGMAAMAPLMAGGGMMAALGAASGGMALVVMLVLAAALALNAAFWFVWPLVAVGGAGPWEAIVLSWQAFIANFGAIALFNLLFFPLLLLALLPAGLGLFVLLPVLAAASYASYVDVFGAPAPR